jgi:hypothetical protein
MFHIIIFNLLLTLPMPALAQSPIPRQGDSCPTGNYRSGDYCKRISGSDREALPREGGKDCPTGWRKSGEYCVEIWLTSATTYQTILVQLKTKRVNSVLAKEWLTVVHKRGDAPVTGRLQRFLIGVYFLSV